MKEYIVSVIIPIFNMELCLKQCLDSILNQTLKEIEIICVDDGSKDKSLEILQDYSSKWNNIVIIRQNRQGAGLARNKGMEISKGKYIAFMDADDYYPTNDVLQYLVHNAELFNVTMAGGTIKRDVNGQLFEHKLSEKHIGERIISFQEYQNISGFYSFIYLRDLIQENNIIFPDFKRIQDLPFMLRAIIASENIWITDRCSYIYCEYDKKINWLSSNIIRDYLNGVIDILELSQKYSLEDIQRSILNGLITGNTKNMIIGHIYSGNRGVKDQIKTIRKYILFDEYLQKFDKVFSDDCMNKFIEIQKNYVSEFKMRAAQKNKVIIYGAGRWGKTFYDFLNNYKEIEVLGFAVTAECPKGTVRGIEVHCIKEFSCIADDVLLAITVKDSTNRNGMISNANRLGFTDIIEITEPLIDFELFNVSNEKFAYGE